MYVCALVEAVSVVRTSRRGQARTGKKIRETKEPESPRALRRRKSGWWACTDRIQGKYEHWFHRVHRGTTGTLLIIYSGTPISKGRRVDKDIFSLPLPQKARKSEHVKSDKSASCGSAKADAFAIKTYSR